MARPLRIEYPGALYHVINRGHRKEKIFRRIADREVFLEKLIAARRKFGIVVHAYCLMDNHYHLVVENRSDRLSHFLRQLQVSYSGAFNWAHRLRGHVFQGRYTAVLIQKEADLAEVARYLHLNPVRIQGLGLGKADQRRARVGNLDDPGAELVRRRLQVLEDHPWSSWRRKGCIGSRGRWSGIRRAGIMWRGCVAGSSGRVEPCRHLPVARPREGRLLPGESAAKMVRLIHGFGFDGAPLSEDFFLPDSTPLLFFRPSSRLRRIGFSAPSTVRACAGASSQ